MTGTTDISGLVILRDFLSLQESLLRALEATQEPLVPSMNSLIPRAGAIVTTTGEWTFQRHGSGVSFKRRADGCTIDVHTRVQEPTVFDAWRLRTYFGSLGRRGIKLIDKACGNRSASLQEKVELWLEQLENQQAIRRLGNAYVLYDP